jgi:ABC-2 type transport system ATP-binding protein
MIEIRHLSKAFGNFAAVDDLTFNVEPGEVLGFLGPNGAGKTTTMRMITGFMAPSSGSVAIYGHDIQAQPMAAKRLLGYLPEGAPAYGDMTPASFLAFVAGIRGLRGAQKKQRIAATVDDLGLQGVLRQPIETLSKGFKRRVGLAQALIHDPAVLVLDEPTDGLDPNQKQQVRELIQRIAAEKIILVSTHILEEVNAVCTRAMIISGGRLVADGSPQELQARSRYHGAVVLKVQSADGVLPALQALPGVAEVAADEQQPGLYSVFPEAGADILVGVSNVAASNGWKIDELRLESGRLDEVFRSLTMGDAQGERQ